MLNKKTYSKTNSWRLDQFNKTTKTTMTTTTTNTWQTWTCLSSEKEWSRLRC